MFQEIHLGCAFAGAPKTLAEFHLQAADSPSHLNRILRFRKQDRMVATSELVLPRAPTLALPLPALLDLVLGTHEGRWRLIVPSGEENLTTIWKHPHEEPPDIFKSWGSPLVEQSAISGCFANLLDENPMAIREIECAGWLAEQRILAVKIYFIIGSDFRAHQLVVKKSFAAPSTSEYRHHIAPIGPAAAPSSSVA